MKKTYYFLLTLLCGVVFQTQAQNLNWAINMGGTLTGTYDVEETGVIVMNDAAGNLINIGNFEGTADFDLSTGVSNLTSTSSTQYSTYFAKYDPNKNLLWAKKVDSLDAFRLVDRHIDNSGNFYISGGVAHTVNFDPNGGSGGIFPYNSSNYDANNFIAKYDGNGNLLWVKNFSGATKMTTDVDNNLYVYGTLNGSVDVDVTSLQVFLAPQYTGAGANYFAKYDVNLNLIFAKKIECGTSATVMGFAGVESISTDNSHIYLCGEYSGTVDFDPSASTANINIFPTGTQRQDIYFAQYSTTDGSMTWAKSIVTNGAHAYIHSLADASGVYLTGITNATALDFDPSPTGVVNYTGSGDSDAYLAKYDLTGALVWSNYLLNTNPFSIALGTKRLYLHTMGSAVIHNPSNTYNNNYLAAYDLNTGVNAWMTAIGGAEQTTLSANLMYTAGGSVTVDAQENVYATGCYYPVPGVLASDFDASPNHYVLTLNGNNTDAYLVKFSPLSLDFTTNKTSYCQGETMTVNFTPFGYYPADNQCTFLLSDAAGSFASPTTLKTLTTSVAGTFTYTLPGNITAGTGYKIRMSVSDPATVPVVEKNITINTVPATPVITGPLQVCGNAQGKTYSITPHAGSTYSWTPPTHASVSGSSNGTQVVLNFAGYTTADNVLLTETNAAGCGSTQATLSIAPLALPVTGVITGSGNVCNNATGKIYSVVNTIGSIYAWTLPNSAVTFQSPSTSNTATLNFSSFTVTGNVQVTETNAAGCTGATVSLPISPLAIPVTSAISGVSSVCGNATGKTYTVTTTSGSTYAWSVIGGGLVSSGQGTNAAVINFNALTNGSISVTETNTAGCAGNAVSLNLTTLPTPATSAITGPAHVCTNATGVNYSVTSNAGSTYAWTFPTGMTVHAGGNPYADALINCSSFTTSANISVVETNTSSGCVGSTVLLFVNAAPTPGFVTVSVSAVNPCGNAKGITYSIPATTGSTYAWTASSGLTITSAPANQNSILVDFNNTSTTETVHVTETTLYGCVGPQLSLTVLPAPYPTPNTISGPTANCGSAYYHVSDQGNSYQWTLPSNAVADGPTNTSSLSMHFTDENATVLKCTETTTYGSCALETSLSITPTPHPTITGQATACIQPAQQYVYSTPAEPGVTYYWSYDDHTATATSNTYAASVSLMFHNLTTSNLISVTAYSGGCSRTAYLNVTPRTSVNPSVIVGPSFTCNTAAPQITYALDHVNNGSIYMWSSSSSYISIVSNPTPGSATVDLSRLVSTYSAGTLSVSEMDRSDGCIVGQISTTITGYAPTPYIIGQTDICDVSKDYTYTVYNPDATSTYNWSSATNSTILSGNGTSTAQVHYSTAANASFTLSESNSLGCTTTVPIAVNYNTSQYSSPAQQLTCARSSVTMTISKNTFLSNINKLELQLSYNPLYASINGTLPYTVDALTCSDGSLPTLSLTESTPGNLTFTVIATSGTYLYYGSNFLSLNFDINHTNMQVGDVNTLQATSITEYLIDGTIQNCHSLTTSITKNPLATTLHGNLIYNADPTITLGYNATLPSQYLITNISGTTASDCSGLSSPIQPDLNGNFVYPLVNANSLTISRDIAPTTSVLPYINSVDANKISTIINGFSPLDKDASIISIYTLLSADVNRDGTLSLVDCQNILDRSVNNIQEFKQTDGTPVPDWSFIDDYSVNNNAVYRSGFLSSSYSDGNLTVKLDPTTTIPAAPSCIPIRYITNGACSEVAAETYHGILTGDVEAGTPWSGSVGYFDNAPGSNLRTTDAPDGTADVVCDLSMATDLGSGKFRFPIYLFAADTAQSMDLQLDYDQTKITIDSVKNSTEEINKDFIYAYNDDNHDVLKISGFGPQTLLSNVTLLYVTVTALDGNVSKDMLGNFDLSLINGKPVEGKIIEATATGITESTVFNGVRLYPNPTSDMLYVTGLENTTASLTVLNALGTTIQGNRDNATTLDVSDLPSGLYYVKVSIDGSDKMYRFIKL